MVTRQQALLREFLVAILCILVPVALIAQILQGHSWRAALLLVSWPILVLCLVFLEGRIRNGPIPPR